MARKIKNTTRRPPPQPGLSNDWVPRTHHCRGMSPLAKVFSAKMGARGKYVWWVHDAYVVRTLGGIRFCPWCGIELGDPVYGDSKDV